MPDHSNTIGILLVNLGTPDAPTATAIRRYLKAFLSDRRVVEVPRPIWSLVLNLFILPFRPYRLVGPYSSIWTARGAPIRYITEDQARRVESRLNEAEATADIRYKVLPAMTYGQPSIPDQLEAMMQTGIRRIVCLPLYPQYSGSTTAASLDVLYRTLMNLRDQPEIRVVRSYPGFTPYIQALAASVREHWAKTGRQGHLLFSFHGIPRSYAEKGDPYPQHCQITAQSVARALGLNPKDWSLSFQSRFGKAEWLQPYTDETVRALGAQGCTALDVICPGFAADCLETLEEINEENRGYYEAAGGQDFHYIPALNSRDDHIAALTGLIRLHSANWPEQGV